MSASFASQSLGAPSPPSSTSTAPKRIRKSRKRTCDDDAQRERKREMDRKAQRLSREKTKSHIAHLEKLVEMLYEKNDSAANVKLLEEVGRLNAEIERLRKIIWSIRNLVGGDVLGNLGIGGHGGSKGSPERENREEGEAKQQNEERSPNHHDGAGHFDSAMDMDDVLEINNDFEESPSSSDDFSGSTAITKRVDHLDAMTFSNYDELIIPSHAQSTTWDEKLCSNYTLAPITNPSSPSSTQLWTFLNNPLGSLISPPQLSFQHANSKLDNSCHLWQRANKIYSNMFTISRESLVRSFNFDSGLLFQVMKDGWDTLSGAERRNPILQILREVDQQLFRHLDRTSRLAIVYKSQALVKYFIGSGTHTIDQLPPWARPIPCQESTQHPIAISFFPWPRLRARLLTSHAHYFSTADFSIAYTRHFKICWPFAFEDTFTYNASTSKYEISPLFERYHTDLRYWGMERSFFERYPELEEDMETYEAVLGGVVGRAFGNVDGDGTLDGRSQEMPFEDVGGMGILEGLPCA